MKTAANGTKRQDKPGTFPLALPQETIDRTVRAAIAWWRSGIDRAKVEIARNGRLEAQVIARMQVDLDLLAVIEKAIAGGLPADRVAARANVVGIVVAGYLDGALDTQGHFRAVTMPDAVTGYMNALNAGHQAASKAAVAAQGEPANGLRACRVCGCTEAQACQTEDGPCRWIEDDLCSGCAPSEASGSARAEPEKGDAA